MNNHNMEYNSQKELLVIPEYGRNVQLLIEHAKTIENPTVQQAFVEKVVNLMHQMHPQNRNIDDYREKLWKHVFRISNYDLQVSPPSGIVPTPDDIVKKPEMIAYPHSGTKFRHYGQNVHSLIQKALAMEPGPVRQGFVNVIGTYMKLAYRTWNKEHYVSDEVIKGDLESLSNGAFVLDASLSLDKLANSSPPRKRPNKRTNSNNNSNSHSNKNNNHRNKNRRKR